MESILLIDDDEVLRLALERAGCSEAVSEMGGKAAAVSAPPRPCQR